MTSQGEQTPPLYRLDRADPFANDFCSLHESQIANDPQRENIALVVGQFLERIRHLGREQAVECFLFNVSSGMPSRLLG
jgi:hypothetical protein